MNITALANLREKAAAHKIIAALILAVLLCGVAYGCYFGWQQYLYRQTAVYAGEKIKATLAPPDPAKLARFVDFRRTSADLAREVARAFPFYKAGADQERNIGHLLQTVFLNRLSAKNDKTPAWPMEEEELLKKDLELLPPDFIEQIVKTMHIRQEGENVAYLSAKVENPMLGQAFPLIFYMERSSSGWRIVRLANAAELVAALREAMLKRHARYRALFADKNAATRKTMDQLLPVQSCSVDAGLMSDGKTLLMVVRAIARNKGDVQINNFNLDAAITGRNGSTVMRRFLNAAKPVAPGEDFDHRWNFELEANSPEARRILANGPLRCQATWQTLSLNNGRVLHIVEEPYPDASCRLDGHNHPEGFCLTPLFRN
ncbi:MAG: translation initiation factor IF-2 [Desulfovibrio sp.]|nr:translation initiation factor IF-2 [Desulfovibrio sp.]